MFEFGFDDFQSNFFSACKDDCKILEFLVFFPKYFLKALIWCTFVTEPQFLVTPYLF